MYLYNVLYDLSLSLLVSDQQTHPSVEISGSLLAATTSLHSAPRETELLRAVRVESIMTSSMFNVLAARERISTVLSPITSLKKPLRVSSKEA
jgi:hypothetical protein